MADDDEDVLGASGREDLFGPPGPRRSNFTPAPTDAESLEAANNVFNDDAIAAALAAELARVASGPIPIQHAAAPPVAVPTPPVPEDAAPPASVEPLAPEALAPPTYVEPAAPEPVTAEPVSTVEPEPVVPETVIPETVIPEPVAQETPASEAPEAITEPDAPVAPAAPPAAPVSPVGPPDWASSLFGQPTPTVRDDSAESLRDPFAPSEPSFAPSSGPFPPPSELDAAAGVPLTADAEALRALYRGAPAPTVPPADVPPPPGYESTPSPAAPTSEGPSDMQVAQLQDELHLQEQEAREFAVWESSMQAIGTPEALAEVARARQELAAAPTPVAVPETPAQPVEPVSTPVESSFAPPEPVAPEPVAPEPIAPEPVAPEPVAPETLQSEPIAPEQSPFPTLDPPTTDFATTDFATMEPAPEWGAAPHPTEPEWEQQPGVYDLGTPDLGTPDLATQFPGFAPPTTEEPAQMYDAPADPRDLTFDPTQQVPDAPVFIEPPALVEPAPTDGVADLFREAESAPPPAPFDQAPAAFEQAPPPSPFEPPVPPVSFEPQVAPAPFEQQAPPVEEPQQTPVDLPPLNPLVPPQAAPPVEPQPQAPIEQPPADLPPLNPLVPPQAAPPPLTAPPTPPPAQFGGFDGLLNSAQDSSSALPAPLWPATGEQPAESGPEDESGGRRPFGEGVDRDDAVDPSDSIFSAAALPVSVNTAGVAVVPQAVSLESRPISTITSQPDPAELSPQLTPPPVLPAEPIGLEPTPLEQRVGRSARLFWLWFAANSSIVAVVFGTIIFGLGVSLRQAIVATLAGVALSFLPLGLGTLAGKRSGQPTMVISRATFGVIGNLLPALIALVSRLFWAAALLWVLGASIADILTGAKLSDGFSNSELTLIVMGLGFLVAVVLGYFGYGLIARVQLVISIVSGISIVGFIALTAQYLNVSTALTAQDGPWILVVTGAVLVFSFVGLAWANSGADVARYQGVGTRGSAAMLWATFGAALPAFVLIAYGALLAASNPTLAHNIQLDPLDSLGRLLPTWYPAPLIAATGLSLLSGVVLAMYSGGFALQSAGLRLRRPLSTLIVGVLVVLLAAFVSLSVTDYAQLVRDVATTVAVPVAAWAGIFGSELMLRKRRFHSPSLLERGGVYADARWGNLLALIVISAIGYGFLSATLAGLGWEGYLFGPLGIPAGGVVATSDFGVLVALGLGILFPLVAGIPGIRKQERAEGSPE